MELQTDLLQHVGNFVGNRPFCIEPLAGDASTRRYHRIKTVDSTFILLDMGHPFEPDSDDFILMRNYLESKRFMVPMQYAMEPELGLVYLQDLGDLTLQESYRLDAGNALKVHYPQAIDIMARMQVECRAGSASAIPAFSRSFDRVKLMYELKFFDEHFIGGYLNIRLSKNERRILSGAFEFLADILAAPQKVFAHRDYHSRNLMVTPDGLFMIDFQDARLGLSEYDLSSLLRDAYVRLPEQVISDLKGRFYEQIKPKDRSASENLFSLMCIQRNLKALGTFGFQASVRNNRYYERYIPVMYDHLRCEIVRRSEIVLKELAGLLSDRLPEFGVSTV